MTHSVCAVFLKKIHVPTMGTETNTGKLLVTLYSNRTA